MSKTFTNLVISRRDFRLLAAIKKDPAKLEVFLTQNPGVVRMLATAYPDLVQASEDKLREALKALHAEPALTNSFEPRVTLTNGTLEARQGLHSKFEFRLILKDVQPDRTQEKLEALVAEMNALFPAMPNYPSCGFKVYLASNGVLPKYDKAGDVVFTCSSLIHDSTNRDFEETITIDGKERISQEALLSQHDLVQVPINVTGVVVGMFRLAQGFPDKQDVIGTERDNGDMLAGKVARTFYSSVTSCQDGVRDHGWYGRRNAGGLVGVVGGLSPELKSFDR